jgi:single-strand DNA-binding protein
MLCKNRITLIGCLGQHAETRFTSNGSVYIRFSIATSVSWKAKETGEYNTRWPAQHRDGPVLHEGSIV